MQACETCRHWADGGFSLETARRLGLIAADARIASCERAHSEADSTAPLMVAYDAAGGGNDSFFTRADFGCVAHEPRDD
jgi:hypothetical protein